MRPMARVIQQTMRKEGDFRSWTKLNLGSGRSVELAADGWVNADRNLNGHDPEKFHVDKLNFLELPWPYKDSEFDYVLASHILEHIPFLYEDGRDIFFHVFEEIHRVLRPNGLLHIHVPRADKASFWTGPEHYRSVTEYTHLQFIPDAYYGRMADAHFEQIAWALGKNYALPHAPRAIRLGPSRTPLVWHLIKRFPKLTGWLWPKDELQLLWKKI